jgi:hypothetical protein
VVRTPSRRDALRLLAGIALPVLADNLGARDAGATHFGCRHVAAGCKRARQCCSGICQRPAKGQPKTCQGHGAGNCQATQDTCLNGASGNNLCGQTPGDCLCWITTGGASYCGRSRIPSTSCKRDKDCEKIGIVGGACIICPNGTGGSVGQCSDPCPNPV